MTAAPALVVQPGRKVRLWRFGRGRMTDESVLVDRVALEDVQRRGRVDELMHKKQVRCPRCGARPEALGGRSEEGARIWGCRLCHIKFAQKLPPQLGLGLCSVVNVRDIERRGTRCRRCKAPVAEGAACPKCRDDDLEDAKVPDVLGDALPVGEPRTVTRDDCRACPWWKYSFAKGRPCPNFKGRIGVDWRKEEHYVAG